MSRLPPPRNSSVSNSQPQNLAKPFETIGASSSPTGLAKTPPLSGLTPQQIRSTINAGAAAATTNPSTSSVSSSSAAAAANARAMQQDPNSSSSQHQQQDEEEEQRQILQMAHQQVSFHQNQMIAVKETAQRDKHILMNRIEDLSRTIHELQRRSSAQTEELESYHRAFGTLDDFTSRQVRVREELVVLRDAVRQWQDRESDARQEASRLEKVLSAVRRGQRHTSGESRLKDIEERLALAHLQRGEIAKEIDDIVEMERTKRERYAVLLQRTAGLAAATSKEDKRTAESLAAELAAAAPGVDGSYLNWQMRGKLADLRRLLRQKDESIESLQQAADSLQAVSRSDRFKEIGSVNRSCPGCNDLPWKTPFCPVTGHKHLAFDPAVDIERRLEQEEKLKAPVFIPLSEEDITARVQDWLSPGEAGNWTMLREVSMNGNNSEDPEDEESNNNAITVLYREKKTGKIVEDLRALVEQEHKNSHEDRVRQYEKDLEADRVRREAMEREAAKDPIPALSVQPSLKSEILTLTAALEAKKDENLRLRSLLEAVCNSGTVGVNNNARNQQQQQPYFPGRPLPSGVEGDGRSQYEIQPAPGERDVDGAPPPPSLEVRDSSSASGTFGLPPGAGGENLEEVDHSSAEVRAAAAVARSSASKPYNPNKNSDKVFPSASDKEAIAKQRELEIALTSAASGGGDPNNVVTTLHDEDDVQTFTKMMRLQRENDALSKRASELVLALVERDDHISQLRETLAQNNALENDRYVSQLRRESAQLRDRLLQEERRASNLEEEVRRLKRFEPRAFRSN